MNDDDDDIPRIGPDEPIKSAANELEAAHQLLDGRPGVIPRDQARDLATRIHSLDAVLEYESGLFGELLQESVRIATGSSCEREMRELARSIESRLGFSDDDLTPLPDTTAD